jgi:hypothetical protein
VFNLDRDTRGLTAAERASAKLSRGGALCPHAAVHGSSLSPYSGNSSDSGGGRVLAGVQVMGFGEPLR